MKKDKLTTRTRHAALFLIVAVSGLSLMTGCKKKEKLDTSTLHTTAAETMAEETTAAPETTAVITLEQDAENNASSNGSGQAGQNITAKKNTHTSGQVSIEYPTVTNLSDTEKAAAINSLMKENALSVLDAYEIDDTKDTLEIQCRVMSADRNRITVIYTGTLTKADAPYPVNIFYSNTIDVAKVESLGLDKFADPYTMAGYVLSGDCQFPEASADVKTRLMTEKNNTSLQTYTTMFQNADFPFEGSFPESFSYEYEGNIYFSIPVSHALGDYAIVMYTPDTK